MEISESSTSKKTNIIGMQNYLDHLRVKLKKQRRKKKQLMHTSWNIPLLSPIWKHQKNKLLFSKGTAKKINLLDFFSAMGADDDFRHLGQQIRAILVGGGGEGRGAVQSPFFS